MTLNDLLDILKGSDRLRIIRNGEDIFVGFLGMLSLAGQQEYGLSGLEKVTDLRASPEIRHKDWKEKGLDAPIQPEEAPLYSFADLRMQLYYKITLEGADDTAGSAERK